MQKEKRIEKRKKGREKATAKREKIKQEKFSLRLRTGYSPQRAKSPKRKGKFKVLAGERTQKQKEVNVPAIGVEAQKGYPGDGVGKGIV